MFAQMGALKYVEELQKKKQSDLLRFLLRVRCWEVCGNERRGISMVSCYTLVEHELRVHQYSFAN